MDVVVGGGWSGIAAAVELASQRRPVTLVEAADRLGGRARRVDYHGRTLDNGQHLLLGACHELLSLQRTLGLDESTVFERRPLELRLLSQSGPGLHLRAAALPAPLHLVAGLLGASGLSITDRLRALRLCAAITVHRRSPDCSVATLLARHRQPPRLTELLWQPLCLAILNTPIESASAAIFSTVLRDAFLHRRSDADLLIPRQDLGELLPAPARHYIEQHGGEVRSGCRVHGLATDGDRVTALRLAGGESLPVSRLIVALPPAAMARLFNGHAAATALIDRLRRFGSYPICTVYLDYPAPGRRQTPLPFPMVGLHGTTAQWAFDHASSGHPGRIAAVISGPGPHMALDNAALGRQVAGELAGFFPDWPAPEATHVLREKRATFIASVGIDELRRGLHSPFRNCRLAGDAVATGYPSTLEGAIRSGIMAARDLAST